MKIHRLLAELPADFNNDCPKIGNALAQDSYLDLVNALNLPLPVPLRRRRNPRIPPNLLSSTFFMSNIVSGSTGLPSL